MIAANYATNRVAEFYAGIRKCPEKSAPFRDAMRKLLQEAGQEFNEESVGAVLLAGLVESFGPAMNSAPPIAQELMAHVFASDIDWKYVARQFVTDENSN